MLYYYKMTTTTEKNYYKFTDARDNTLLLMGCSTHPNDKRLAMAKNEAKYPQNAKPYVNNITSTVGWDNVAITTVTQAEHAAYVKSLNPARCKAYQVKHKEQMAEKQAINSSENKERNTEKQDIAVNKKANTKAKIIIGKDRVTLAYYVDGKLKRKQIKSTSCGDEVAVQRLKDFANEQGIAMEA
jgi:hypothetical protein